MKKNLMAAAVDIVFSTVVFFLFYGKLQGWALQFCWTHFPQAPLGIVALAIQAAALAIYILYIKLLTEAKLSDYYLSGVPKLRFLGLGILAAVLYTAIVQLLFPGKWTIQIGEPALSSITSAVFRSVRRYIINAEYFYVILFGGLCFGALIRRGIKLSIALLVVGILAAVLNYDVIYSVTAVTNLLFYGIQAAAFCMISLYTGSVWSAVLLDFSFGILMDYDVFRFFHGFHVPHPDDIKILFIHQADNTNELLNRLFFGHAGPEHARSVPMAVLYLLLIAYLYAKIRRKEAKIELSALPSDVKKLSEGEMPKTETERELPALPKKEPETGKTEEP